jgi:hypothetical protein
MASSVVRANVNDIAKLSVTVKVTGVRRFRFRCWLLGVMLKLTAIVVSFKITVSCD